MPRNLRAIAQACNAYLLVDDETPAGFAHYVIPPRSYQGLLEIDKVLKFTGGYWTDVIYEPSQEVLDLVPDEVS